MELVYLWVEDYKNIHRQGFNFSPQFECDYHDGILNIKDKEEAKEPYLKDFFAKNINVTAIVGENGSGKSSLLELLFLNHKNYKENKYRYIIFFKEQQVIKYFSSFNSSINVNENYSSERLIAHDFNEVNIRLISSLSKIHYSPEIRNQVRKTNEHFSEMNYYRSIITKSLLLFSSSNNMFRIKDKNINFNTVTIMIKEINTANYDVDSDEQQYINKLKKFIKVESTNYPFDTILKLPPLKNLIKNNILTFLLHYFLGREKEMLSYLKIFKLTYDDLTIKRIVEFLNEHCSYDKDDNIVSVLNNANYLCNFISNHTLDLVKNGSKEVGYEITFDIENNTELLNEFVKNLYSFIDEFSESYIELQMIKFDLKTNNNLYLTDLSDGEKNIYSTLVDFKYEFLFDKSHYFLLLDEPDNFLHPNWTKEFISILLNNIEKQKVHIILTSHSPFILSDLPKENVIFLEKYTNEEIEKNSLEQKIGNCKNASHEIEINPFGANIHTLLSHGFFMKNGLMGEFAKTKINDIIDFFNNKKTIDEISTPQNQIKSVIDNIGEDLLRMKLTDMYFQVFTNEELEREKLKLLNLQNDITKQIESIEKKQYDSD